MHGNLEDSRASRVRHSNALYNTLEATLTGSFTIRRDGPQFYYFNANGVDRNINLPAIERGGGQYYIIGNVGTVGNLLIRDSGGVLLRTVIPNSNNIVNSSKTQWFISPLSTTGAGGAGVSTTGPVSVGQLAAFADSSGLLIQGSTAVPVTDGNKGDITVSSAGTVWTINPKVVTYAKMQDVTSGRIHARVTAGSGIIEEVTLSQVLDLVGGATWGDIMFRGSAGWQRLPASGTPGQFLRTQGVNADPSWATPAGGGGGGDVFLANPNQFTNTNFFNLSTSSIIVGANSILTGRTDTVQISLTSTTAALGIFKWSADAAQGNMVFFKSRGATVNSNVAAQSGDALGLIGFNAANGTGFAPEVQIRAVVTGALTGTTFPAALTIHTAKDSTESLQRRGAVTGSGAWVIGDRDTPVNTNGIVEVHNQVNTGSDSRASVALFHWGNDNGSARSYESFKSRGTTIGSHVTVTTGDVLWQAVGYGSDGSAFSFGAVISMSVDGAVNAGQVPSNIGFSTRAPGSSSIIRRMTIASSGDISMTSTTDSTSTATGAVTIAGGLGVAKKIYATGLDVTKSSATGPAADIGGIAGNFSGGYIGLNAGATHNSASSTGVAYYGHSMIGTINFQAGSNGSVFYVANYVGNINIQGGAAPALTNVLNAAAVIFGANDSGSISQISAIVAGAPQYGPTGSPSVTVGMMIGVNVANQNISGAGLTLNGVRGISVAGQTNGYGVYIDAGSTLASLYAADKILCASPNGMGYTTGAGGSVTQTTSRTTAVTINKATGSITLFSAAGSTAFQTFTVNNSVVAAIDTVRVSQQSGTDKYAIWVTRVFAGGFDITFATLSGTTTEQPVFNFAVLKGANA